MKKPLSIITLIVLSFSIMISASGCMTLHIYQPESTQVEYETEYSYDDKHHWINQVDGDEKIEYGEHYNQSGKCMCGYYFPCHNLVYQLTTIGGKTGYQVIDYDEDMAPQYLNVEVPKTYQSETDIEPISVISIADYALSNRGSGYGKCDVKLESIKLNEGLLEVGDGAFCHSNITEITIPNSVVGSLAYTFMQCSQLERIVIGDGITEIKGYVFHGLPKCEEVVLGSSIKEIKTRSFIDCKALKSVVIPASLVSIPESSHASNAEGCEPQVNLFMNSGAPDIYMNITEEELAELTLPLFPRDANGSLLNPDGTIAHKVTSYYDKEGNLQYSQETCTHYGLVTGWQGSSKIYFLGEWEYDKNNVPTPIEF